MGSGRSAKGVSSRAGGTNQSLEPTLRPWQRRGSRPCRGRVGGAEPVPALTAGRRGSTRSVSAALAVGKSSPVGALGCQGQRFLAGVPLTGQQGSRRGKRSVGKGGPRGQAALTSRWSRRCAPGSAGEVVPAGAGSAGRSLFRP